MKQPILRNLLSFSSPSPSQYCLNIPIAVLAIGILAGCGVSPSTSSPGTVVAASHATAAPTSLTWGNVPVGQAGGPKSVTVTNNDTSTITISNIAITGTDAGDFAIYQNTCGTTLAASATCTVTVLFNPTTTGTRTATLVITDTGSGSPQEVSLSGTGTGSVTISPSTVSFGSVNVDAKSTSQTVTISNTSGSSVTLSAPSLSGTDPADFSISSTTCGTALAASATCTASVVFTPTAAGSRSATFSITSSSSSTALTAALSGTGTAVSSGNVTVSPTSLTWGTVTVGNASGQKSVTLTNSGSAAISMNAPTFTGANSGDFSVYNNGCGGSLAGSSTCTVSILFKPIASGTRTATLNFTDSDPSSPQQVSVSGTGASNSVTALPSSLNFGSINQGSHSPGQSISIFNGTSASVTLGTGAISGTNAKDFSISNTSCGTSLAASSGCNATITFNPTISGAENATWTLTAGSTTLSVSLSGTGGNTTTGSVTASPTSLSFGSVKEGSTSTAQTITVSNTTPNPASLSAGSITGANAGDFSVQFTTCGSTLPASGTCTASVVFKPSTTSAESATWTMTAGSDALTVSLSGTGTSGGGTTYIVASPTAITWGSVAVGNAGGQKPVTLTNSGTSAVSIGSIAFTGADPGDFSIFSNTCGSSLAGNSSCTVTLLFKPTVSGTRTATLTITDSDPSSPQQVSVSGTGTGGSGSGSVTASPGSLAFGSVNVGSTSTSQTITVSNGTTASVTIGTGAITGTNAGDFSISSTTCGSTLAASANCTATVVFKPTATGTRSASWGMTVSSSSTPLSVALSGTGSNSTSGSVTVSPTSLSFGTVTSGSTSTAQSVTITNGTSASVTLGTGAISGTGASDFKISSTTCGTALAAAGTCTASITFSPATTGSLAATWSMTVSSSSTPLSVALSGTGGTAGSGGATVNPTSLSYGSVAVGSTSQAKSIILTNNETSSISVSSVTLSGANPGDFSINSNGCNNKTLTSKQGCAVTVFFNPTATGTRTATLTFVDTATNSPQSMTLSGTGTPAATATLTISPSSLTFGSQNVGSQSSAQTFTLTAGGSGTVSFTSIGFTGTDPGDFSITANACGTSLNAGSTCTVSVAFKPTAIGNRVALFSVIDNATTTNQTAEVSGAGANSSAQTPAITVDFGSRSKTQVAIPGNMLGTEYLESLPTSGNITTVVQAGFTTARYRLQFQTVFPSSASSPSWGAVNTDINKFKAAGVHPIVILENTPNFLQPSPTNCPYAPETAVPTSFTGWGQLAAQVVAHLDATFGNWVQTYEIWNEPNTTALCSTNQLNDYISIYSAAAPLMQNQAKADGATIQIGGAATAGVGFSSIMTNSATDQYVDFYSYHYYLGSATSIQNGMTWDGSGGTPSLKNMLLDSSTGIQARFIQAYNYVKIAKTPLGAKTPIYYDEYNDDWAFENDCCRNNPTYSPLYNSMLVAQLLNSVYDGAGTVPSKLVYYSAAQDYFCILGIIDANMDCSKAVTGAQAQPYPQWYTYRLMFAPSFLDLQDPGNMATSVTLSSSAKSNGLIATAYYTATSDSVLIINPTGSSYSGVTLQINNAGLTPSQSTLYTMACPLGHNPTTDASCGTNIVSSFPATLITTSGNLQATFDVPSYSVLAVSLKN